MDSNRCYALVWYGPAASPVASREKTFLELHSNVPIFSMGTHPLKLRAKNFSVRFAQPMANSMLSSSGTLPDEKGALFLVRSMYQELYVYHLIPWISMETTMVLLTAIIKASLEDSWRRKGNLFTIGWINLLRHNQYQFPMYYMQYIHFFYFSFSRKFWLTMKDK